MIVKICTCEQCRYGKRNTRTKLKKRIKRLLNRRRRRWQDDNKISNWYWR